MLTKIYKILQRKSFYDAIDDKEQVVFSSDPSLSLPLIPLEDDINSLFMEAGGKYYKGHELEYRVAIDFFSKGYKAAKAKKYSEEDMLDIYSRGRVDGQVGLDHTKTVLALYTPSLKAIEIEMTCGDYGEKEGLRWWPKLTKDNFVIVKKYIYE